MLRIGSLELASPVVLAPMAGVTNAAFRVLCREQELARVGAVSGLYVCEMVTARALAEHHPATLDLMRFAPSESPRSVQLYTVDPEWTSVSYTHLTLPTKSDECRSRWSPYH